MRAMENTAEQRPEKFAILAAVFVLGVAIDFLFNGVFKIVWILIYGPAYCVAGKVLASQMAPTRWANLIPSAVVTLLCGTLIGHLALVGRGRTLAYSMKLTGTSPIVLASSDWPQTLVVSSEKLGQALSQGSPASSIPVSMTLVADYGCTRTSTVDTIGGVDVRTDRQATWVWKTDPHATNLSVIAGPGTEDLDLPWCRIKFYRN